MNVQIDFNMVTVLASGFVFWTITVVSVVMWLNSQFNKLHLRLIKVELRIDMISPHPANNPRSSNDF